MLSNIMLHAHTSVPSQVLFRFSFPRYPEHFQQEWRQQYPLVPARPPVVNPAVAPQQLTVRHHLPRQQVEQFEEPSVHQRKTGIP